MKRRSLLCIDDSNSYYKKYFTIESLEDNNTIKWRAQSSSYAKNILISTNGGITWTSKSPTTSGVVIATLNTGDKILVRASGVTYNSGNTHGYNYFESNKTVNVYGNIHSLLYSSNFVGRNTCSAYCLHLLFRSLKIVDASNLILPATTLAEYCYYGMFSGCTSLTTAPELPATTLASRCYYLMFYGCSDLTTAPLLPATTLAEGCYYYMFHGCTLLTTAPELPATTLAQYCYSNMFQNCTGLIKAPSKLPATTLENYCYYYMFSGCTSLEESPELPKAKYGTNCYTCIFNGCTSLSKIKCLAKFPMAAYYSNWVNNVAPSGVFIKHANCVTWTTGTNGIPSGWTVQNDENTVNDYSAAPFTIESLSDNNTIKFKAINSGSSYVRKIQKSTDGKTWSSDITSHTSGATVATLNTGDKIYIRCNGSIALNSDSIYNYFTSTGDFKVSGNAWTLLNGTDLDYYDINTITLTNYTFNHLFFGCTKLKDASNLILPFPTLASYCYLHMFYDCTSLLAAPELPATTLSNGCYQYMFRNCTSLTTAPELPAKALLSNCYQYMFTDCSSLNYIKCLAVNIGSITKWVENVAATGTFIKNPNNSFWTTGMNGIPEGWTVLNDANMTIDYKEQYLTVESLENNNNIYARSGNSKTIYYSTDGITWSSKSLTTSNTTLVTLNTGEKVYLRGQPNSTNANYQYNIRSSADIKVYGNAMSMCCNSNIFDPDDLTIHYTYALRGLFMENSKLKDISNLVLPATTLTESCYYYMFYNCKGLTSIPSGLLSAATTLAEKCYLGMFSSCTGLTNVPENLLPATVMKTNCYAEMFSNCTNLINTPKLPALTLDTYCYNGMFTNCTSLTELPKLPATTLASACYILMFKGCIGITRIPSNKIKFDMATKTNCYQQMFAETGLTEVPKLKSMSLTQNCYYQMFRDCTNLTHVPADMLPATTLATLCYCGMFKGCTSLEEGPQLVAYDLTNSCYAYMFQNCTSLNSVTILAKTKQTNSLSGWLENVASNGNVYTHSYYYIELPDGSSGIPLGWGHSYINTPVSYEEQYFTIESLTDSNTISISCTGDADGTSYLRSVYVSRDRVNWNSAYTNYSSYTLNYGELLYFKPYGDGIASTESTTTKFVVSGNFRVFGNILNLVSDSDKTNDYLFKKLFDGCTTLKDISNLVIPSTISGSYALSYMFNGCTGLTSVPKNLLLSRTTMPLGFLQGMFKGCTALTNGPDLPNISSPQAYCYNEMFSGCTSLTKSPILPFTTIPLYGYKEMFYGCTNLSEVTCLATNISATECVDNWLYNVKASGTFHKKSTMTSWPSNASGIPSGWTTVDYVEE